MLKSNSYGPKEGAAIQAQQMGESEHDEVGETALSCEVVRELEHSQR
jgi:hypothetical protein